MDAINESNKTIISKRDELRDKRTEIKKQKDAKYEQIRKIRSDFDEKFASFKKQLAEEKRDVMKNTNKDCWKKNNKRRKNKLKRNWLKLPFQLSPRKSIPSTLCCLTLTHLMSNQPRKPKPMVLYQSITTLERLNSQKTLLSLKGTRRVFAGTKGKKGKQHQKKSTKHKNFTVAPEVVVALSDLTIAFPTKEEEVPETIKTLKETLTALEEKQEEQTKINIERAKARIAKLEAEEDKEEEFETTAEEKTKKLKNNQLMLKYRFFKKCYFFTNFIFLYRK